MITKYTAPSLRFAVAATACLALVSVVGCNRDPNVRKHKYLESGNRFEREGKHREAVIQYSNAIKVDPNFADAHYALAMTYKNMGSMMPAYTELLRTVDLVPSNRQARLDLGTLEIGGGPAGADKAKEQANALLAMNPNDADAYNLLAQVAAIKGDRAEAAAQLQHALQLAPNNASFHTNLAIIEGFDAASSAKAQQELQQAIALDPKAANAHLELANQLSKKGDANGAIREASTAVELAPKDLQARIALGTAYLLAGNTAGAEKSLRDATDALNDTREGADLLSDFYVGQGKLDSAESAYAALAARHPDSVPLQTAYARILVARSEFEKARPMVKELSKKNGSDPAVQVLNAKLLVADGKVNEAYDLMQKAAKDSPANAELQLALGKVALLKGDAGAAQTAFQQAVKIAPGNFEAQSELAGTASRRGDSNLLAQIANAAIQKYPGFPDAYVWRGTAEANRQQLGEAEADFQTALKLNPNNAGALANLGQMRFMQKRVHDGVPLLEKAVQVDPTQLGALNLLVNNDLTEKQPDRATARIQQQIAKVPQNANLYAMLASLQLATKNFSGAKESAQKAMQLDPSQRSFVEEYARAVAATGDKDASVVIWTQWVAKNPKDSAAITYLGMAQESKGDIAAAMDTYKKALDLDAHQIVAANNLAYLMVENGKNTDVALSLAQGARQALPNSPSIADTLAWVEYHKGAYASARDLLEDALKQAPEDPSIRYHLGMVCLQLGDKTNAALHLKKAVSLAPGTPIGKNAQAALAQLG